MARRPVPDDTVAPGCMPLDLTASGASRRPSHHASILMASSIPRHPVANHLAHALASTSQANDPAAKGLGQDVHRIWVRARAAVKPADPANALGAGGQSSFVDLGDGWVLKMTTEAEVRSYRQFGSALRGILPKHRLPEDLDPAARARIASLMADSPNPHALVLEKIDHGIPLAHRRMLDVKIIPSASFHGHRENGAGVASAAFHKISHGVADVITGAASRGYGVMACKLHGEPQHNLFHVLRHSRDQVRDVFATLPPPKAAIARATVFNALRRIQQATATCPVTFIGSSVYIAIDERHPERSTAKLIDLANPIGPDVTGSGAHAKYHAEFQHGLANLMQDIRDPRGWPAA